MTAENQKQKAMMHRDYVLAQQQRKEQKIIDSIDRGVEEVQRRNEEKLRFERALKEEVIRALGCCEKNIISIQIRASNRCCGL